MARGQQIGVVGPKRRRRSDDRQLADARRLRRHGGHQHGRRIRRRAARHANSHPPQRQIPLPQIPAAGHFDAHIVRQNRRLKSQDIVANPPHGRQKLGRCGGMCGGQIRGRHADRLRRKLGPIDAGRIIQHGRQPLAANVVANPLDDLRRRQRLAEHFDRPPPAGLAHHALARTEPLAQFGECSGECRIRGCRIAGFSVGLPACCHQIQAAGTMTACRLNLSIRHICRTACSSTDL